MISDEGKGKKYVEEQAHGGADDRGAETTGGGTQGGTVAWRIEYNEERLHSSLGYKTPKEFAEASSKPLHS